MSCVREIKTNTAAQHRRDNIKDYAEIMPYNKNSLEEFTAYHRALAPSRCLSGSPLDTSRIDRFEMAVSQRTRHFGRDVFESFRVPRSQKQVSRARTCRECPAKRRIVCHNARVVHDCRWTSASRRQLRFLSARSAPDRNRVRGRRIATDSGTSRPLDVDLPGNSSIPSSRCAPGAVKQKICLLIWYVYHFERENAIILSGVLRVIVAPYIWRFSGASHGFFSLDYDSN